MILASIKYDFECSEYIISLDDNDQVQGYGNTIEEAIAMLRHQANKHELWPKQG